MKKHYQKFFVLLIALLLGVSALKVSAHTKEANQYIKTVENTWEVSLPKPITEEAVECNFNVNVYDYTFNQSNAEKLADSFEWTSSSASIISIINEAQSYDNSINTNDLLELIDFSSPIKVHVEFKDKGFMILELNTNINTLRIIENI